MQAKTRYNCQTIKNIKRILKQFKNAGAIQKQAAYTSKHLKHETKYTRIR